MTILVATQNPGKLAEIKAVLGVVGVKITDPASKKLGQLEVEETGSTLEANALLKAQAFAEASHLTALSDDSGLEVEALNGEPGVHSKRFAAGSDADRNQHLLNLMKDQRDRKAMFKTVMCLYDPETQTPVYFEGLLPGRITFKPAGSAGFGYDPIFIPDGYSKTLAELGMDVKNKLSHRAQALQKVQKYLVTENKS